MTRAEAAAILVRFADSLETGPAEPENNAYDFDAEGYTPPASGTTSITAEQAQQIALEKVPGATERDIYEFEVDRDDGRLVYEGEMRDGRTEYEFEIDAVTGAVLSWEVE